MTDIKIRLALNVQGALRVSWEEAQKHPKTSYDTSHIKVEYGSKGERQYETIVVKTLKNRTVKQSIQISKVAYDYMINEPPSEKYNRRVVRKKKAVRLWDTLTINQKLDYHFKRMAEDLGAKSFSYEILDD